MANLKLFKNGALVQIEKCGAMYVVLVRNPAGAVHDRIRCDDYRDAMEYRRAFCAIAAKL